MVSNLLFEIQTYECLNDFEILNSVHIHIMFQIHLYVEVICAQYVNNDIVYKRLISNIIKINMYKRGVEIW